MNLGGSGCREPRPCDCTPAWTTEQDFILKKKKKLYLDIHANKISIIVLTFIIPLLIYFLSKHSLYHIVVAYLPKYFYYFELELPGSNT